PTLLIPKGRQQRRPAGEAASTERATATPALLLVCGREIVVIRANCPVPTTISPHQTQRDTDLVRQRRLRFIAQRTVGARAVDLGRVWRGSGAVARHAMA